METGRPALRRAFSPTIIALALAPLLAVGCGYQQGPSDSVAESLAATRPSPKGYQWKSLYREDIRTVAVPIFTNRAFREGVEFRLTTALIKQIEAETPYKVVPRDRADTVLEGEITDIALRTISSDPHTSLPQEQLYRVKVNFVWKDLRTGKVLVQRRRYEQDSPFYSTLGEGEFVGSQLNVENLASGIVHELEAEW